MKGLSLQKNTGGKWTSTKYAVALNTKEQKVLEQVCYTLDKGKSKEQYELGIIRERKQSMPKGEIMREECGSVDSWTETHTSRDLDSRGNSFFTWSKQGDKMWGIKAQFPGCNWKGRRSSSELRLLREKESDQQRNKVWGNSSRCPPLPPLPNSSLVALGLNTNGLRSRRFEGQDVDKDKLWEDLKKCRYLRLPTKYYPPEDETF